LSALRKASEPDVFLPDYAQVLWQPARHYALFGGRGGAKSHSVAKFLLIEGASKDLRIGCGREIQKNISESVKQLLDDQIELLGLGDYFESLDTEIRGKRTDTLFTFHGLWRNPKGLKSMEGYDWFWGEEASAFSQTSIRTLIPTLRKETSRFIWTWNPEYEHDPIDRMFRGAQGPPPNSIVRRVGWEDNPWFPRVLREAKDHDYATDPDMAEHVWGGDYVKAIEGAYYAKQLRAAREQGRVTALQFDPNFQVLAYWDLGHSDATAIWIVQRVENRVHMLDYCEGVGQAPGYYMNWLRANGYEGAMCVLPHDGASVHPDNPLAMSYESQMRAAGFPVKVVANQGKGAAMQRIDAARRLFPSVWFNEDPTRPGVRALGHYHEKRHEERNVGLGPEHDWSSHAADAFGLMAIDYRPPSESISVRLAPRMGTMA
jgi:phage terminase large subunit